MEKPTVGLRMESRLYLREEVKNRKIVKN